MAGNPVEQETFRTFLAVPLSHLFLSEFSSAISALQKKVQGVKWVLPEQVHITLHFFGKTTADEIKQICSIVEPIVKRRQALNVSLSALGFFPNFRRPRVIWIGLNDEGCRLADTRREIETQLGEAGFVLENRPFAAHATIGRVKSYSGKPLEGQPELPPIQTEFRTIDHLILYQSHLSPKGPRYEALETFHFSEKPGS